MKGLAKEHICNTSRHLREYGNASREGSAKAGWRRAKEEKIVDICDSINNKNKEQIKWERAEPSHIVSTQILAATTNKIKIKKNERAGIEFI